jgi:glycosyltransferase involved in cell wall biosynthesis
VGSPLRILHVVVNMNRGGAETLIMNLYRNVDKNKVQFDFLTCKEGVFDEEIKTMGGIVHRIPYISDVGHYKYVKTLEQFFFRNNHYKIVHSHLDKMSGFVLRAAKKACIPVRISHSHNTSSEGGMLARSYKWYASRFIIPNATNLFACSNEAAQWLFEKKSNSTKILKNGIESNQFIFTLETRNQVRKELGIDNGSFVLGHVGRFYHQKNHSFLIDVFKEYSQKNNQAVLLLVGDGVLRPGLEKKVKDLNLSTKVKFLGIREDIHRVLQAFDTFVFPSLHEGLPVSLIEAQAAGLPCLISDTISREVDLELNLVNFLPLSDKSYWINHLTDIASSQKTRSLTAESLSVLGYDIRETAKYIENYYLKISG